jgi:N-acetylglucosaminyl-diphospho-decaprenol L-rhamnosyltransferase
MRIFIIIVNYRSADMVKALLASIARHGTGWVERVIVVDNASGDGSGETLRSEIASLGISDWGLVLDASNNHGFGAGNNLGAESAIQPDAKHDILWFLNPDTLVDDLDLPKILNWFRSYEDVGIVGTGLANDRNSKELGGHRDASPMSEFIESAGKLGVLNRFAISDESLDRPGPVDWVSGASLLIRTDVFEQLGGFDEGFFLYFEEVDLCRRARDAGWKVVYEPRTCVVHLEGATTGVSQAKPMPRYWYESRRRYFVKHYGVLGLWAADLAWGFGRIVGMLRRRAPTPCRWRDLWRCDVPVLFGKQKLECQHVQR